MKNYLFLFIILVLFYGCNSDKKTAEQEKAKVDSLQSQLSQRDQTVNGFLSSYNEIEDNLNKIKEKEKIITLNTSTKGELKQNVKDQINADIQTIYDLLLKNKKIIASLNDKLKNSNIKIDQLQKMIEILAQQIMDKDASIDQLKQQLAKLNIDVAHLSSHIDSLNQTNEAKQGVINQQISELNTAYYITGTRKQLLAKKIITKEGGFIGIGKSDKLTSNFDNSLFTKIDITKTIEIKLHMKKFQILTTHPANSYRTEGKDIVEKLIITNASQFWSISKYLVVAGE